MRARAKSNKKQLEEKIKSRGQSSEYQREQAKRKRDESKSTDREPDSEIPSGRTDINDIDDDDLETEFGPKPKEQSREEDDVGDDSQELDDTISSEQASESANKNPDDDDSEDDEGYEETEHRRAQREEFEELRRSAAEEAKAAEAEKSKHTAPKSKAESKRKSHAEAAAGHSKTDKGAKAESASARAKRLYDEQQLYIASTVATARIRLPDFLRNKHHYWTDINGKKFKCQVLTQEHVKTISDEELLDLIQKNAGSNEFDEDHDITEEVVMRQPATQSFSAQVDDVVPFKSQIILPQAPPFKQLVPEDAKISDMTAHWKKNINKWMASIESHRTNHGQIHGWLSVMGPTCRSFIENTMLKAMRQPDADTLIPSFVGRKRDGTLYNKRAGAELFDMRWIDTTGANSPWPILRQLFPISATVTSSTSDRLEKVRDLINGFDYRAPKTDDRIKAFEEAMDQIMVQTSLVGVETLFNVSVEDSQDMVPLLLERLRAIVKNTATPEPYKKYVKKTLENYKTTTFFNYPADYMDSKGVARTYPSIRIVCSWYASWNEDNYTQWVVTRSEMGFDTEEEVDQEPKKRKAAPAAAAPSTSTELHTLGNATAGTKDNAQKKKKTQKSESSSTSTASTECQCCGRGPAKSGRTHTRDNCNFRSTDNPSKKPHPDAVMKGDFKKSEAYALLQKMKDASGKPFECLQYGRRVVCKDGKYEWQPTTEGPQRLKTQAKVSDTPSNVVSDHSTHLELVSILSLLNRGEGTFQGEVNGQEATILIDTGATDYNYINRRLVTSLHIPILDVNGDIRVSSVHAASVMYTYCIVNVVVSYGNYACVTMDLPCLVLDSDSPCDVILGMPAITQYNLLETFKSYFDDRTLELQAKQAHSFPHFQATSSSNSRAQREVSGVFSMGDDTSGRQVGDLEGPFSLASDSIQFPLPRAPILPTDSNDISRGPHSSEGSRDTVKEGPTSVHPHAPYTVIPKDELLNIKVAPDSDSIPTDEPEPPDPVAAAKIPQSTDSEAPWKKVQLYGNRKFRRRLARLLAKYPEIFAVKLDKSPTKIKPFHFPMQSVHSWRNSKGSRQQPRPLSHDKEIALEEWIKAALEAGIISEAPAVANWSQILMVLKPNGKEYRFCVDYTLLNSFMESAGWPIPHIGSILRRVASKGPRLFATMDATQGFYQAEVELSSREFLCFTTFLGNFMWNRAPMGPKTVPAMFQRAMCVEVFPDLIHKIMEVYIDDFIVWARTEDELISRLEEVFKRCEDMNLKLNPLKCRFGMEEVEYCGHVINKDGVTFSAERISEVLDFKQPQTQGALKSFLGMAGYMRDHVPHYVDVVHPLQELVSHYTKPTKHTAIVWTPETNEAFDKFKTAISNVYLLYHRDPTGKAPIRLYTDASSYGIGAYICQVVTLADGTLQEQPLGFISKSLSETEKRWSVYEKEAYAIFYACKKWEHYLRGNHFHLFTDHRNLTFLNKPPNEKAMRWRLAIQEFDFSVAFIQGVLNNVADAMSRCLPETTLESDTMLAAVGAGHTSDDEPPVPESWSFLIGREKPREQYVVPEEETETFLGLLYSQPDHASAQYFPSFRRQTDISLPDPRIACSTPLETSYVHALVSDISTTVSQDIVQNEQSPLHPDISALIASCHNTVVGHGGVDRTLQLLQRVEQTDASKKHLFDNWTCQRADVRRFVKTCPICQKIKQHQLLKYTPHFSTSTYGIFDNVSIDTIYMPESTRGYKYLLVIIDSFSRYLDLYPIEDLTALRALSCFLQFTSNFGTPSHVCCDNGSQFLGIFREFLGLLRVNHITTHPYSHQENGIVERANKEILTTLRALVLERRLSDDWDILCHVAKRIINSRVHSAIGIAPADLVFAGRIDLQRGSLFPYKTPEAFYEPGYMTHLMEQQEIMLAKAFKLQQEHNKTRLKDNDHSLRTIFPVDSYVLAKPEREPTSKLAPRLLGPYLVTDRFPRGEGDVYRCLHLSTNQSFDFRVDRLTPYFTTDEASLRATAMLDDESYEVEAVLDHRFRGQTTAKNLQLHIKWLGYEETQWQNYISTGCNLNEVGIVHEYLRSHQLARFVPARFAR